MPKRYRYDAFISYSSADAAWAARLKAELERHGLKVWIDSDELRPGDPIVETLETALNECRSFLLIVSPSSIKSQWVREEYHRAVSLAKSKARPLRLIPVILGKAELPGFLGTRSWVEFLDDSTFVSNLQRLIWGIKGKKEPSPPRPHHAAPCLTAAAPGPVNPYIFERPAAGAHFFGRGAEMARLTNALREGRSVIVYGLQRVGKTSLVKEALDRELQVNGAAIRDIRIDMYESANNLTSYIDFFETIVDRLCDHLSPADYKRVRDDARLILRTGSDEKAMRSRIKNLLLAYRKNYGMPLLYIDEFQDISKSFERAQALKTVAHPLDSGFVKYLGSLVKDGILQLLCCGRYQVQAMDSRLDWQLLKLMVPIELSVLDPGSARQLITEPVEGRLEYDSQAVDKLLLLSGCYPYLLQYLCFELVEKARHCGRTRIDEQAVADLAEIVQEPQVRLLYSDFQDLDEGVPWRLLVAIAHLASREQQRVSWESIADLCEGQLDMRAEFSVCAYALTLLKNSQIVGEEQTGSTLSYFIRPDILRIWLRTRNHFFKERIARAGRPRPDDPAAQVPMARQTA
jgi:hypothetical protein